MHPVAGEPTVFSVNTTAPARWLTAIGRFQQWPLAVKLTLISTLLVAAAVASVTTLAIERERAAFQIETERQAELTLDTLEVAAADPLYYLDVDRLNELATRLRRHQELLLIVFYDKRGERIAGDDGSSPGEDDAWGVQLLASDETLFQWRPDRLTAGKAVIVSGQRLGGVSLSLSTAALQATTEALRNQGLAAMLGMLVVGVLLAILLSYSVTRSLEQLTRVAESLAMGDLKPRANVTGSREIALLGSTFNAMAENLQLLIETLEERVAERTAELTKANAELLMAKEKALEAVLFKSQILANVSHDVRTPITVISLRAQMLQSGVFGPISDSQKSALASILSSTKQMMMFLNNMLDAAQLEAGKLQLREAQFSLSEILQAIESTMRPLAEKKGLELTTTVADDLPQSLFGDPNRLTQIVFNLAGNAIKFTDEGCVQVHFYCPDANHWGFRVSDTGAGIPAEAQSHLFDAFYQVDGSTTRKVTQGVGLGLSIVKQLVDIMRGTISVESAPQAGSAFTVKLPLRRIQETVS